MMTSTTKEGFEIGFLKPDEINYGTLKTRHKSDAYLIQQKETQLLGGWVWFIQCKTNLGQEYFKPNHPLCFQMKIGAYPQKQRTFLY